MDETLSIGWMKLALRAQVCAQCDPGSCGDCSQQSLDPHSCEPGCAYFSQLPRLALLLKRYRAKPPDGYEDFAIKLLHESSKDGIRPDLYLNFAYDALAILEKVAALLEHSVEKAKPAMVGM